MKPQKDGLEDETEEVVILPPNYALKRTIGEDVDLRHVFSETVIQGAQEKVDKEQKNFLDWVAEDLSTLDHAYRALVMDLEQGRPFLEKLRRAAFTIKSQAGTFGYDLASQMARSLYTFCDVFGYRQEQCIVLRKHIDVLQLIFRDRISGNGGPQGPEILKEIGRLTLRFRQ